jgi:hypothetical protein
LGCNALKELIEGDKLILNDFDIISELSTFIAKGQSFEASSGYHDDLVSCLVMFGWMTTQPYFQDISNLDVRKKIYEEKIKKLEEELIPFGFIDSGLQDDYEKSSSELGRETSISSDNEAKSSNWAADKDEIF